jgi:hypothetical protein
MLANAGILATHGVVQEDAVVASQSMKVTGGPAKAMVACTYLYVSISFYCH